MGCSDELIRGAVRISLGATTTEEEIDQGALRLTAVFRRLAPQARSV